MARLADMRRTWAAVVKYRLHLIIVLPMALFTAADIATTYAGVCVLGGYEANQLMIAVVGALGFVPSMAVLAVWNMSAMLYVAAWLVRERNPYMRIFLMALYALAFVNQFVLVTNNSAQLLGWYTQTVPLAANAPIGHEAALAFDRVAFCRMW